MYSLAVSSDLSKVMLEYMLAFKVLLDLSFILIYRAIKIPSYLEGGLDCFPNVWLYDGKGSIRFCPELVIQVNTGVLATYHHKMIASAGCKNMNSQSFIQYIE